MPGTVALGERLCNLTLLSRCCNETVMRQSRTSNLSIAEIQKLENRENQESRASWKLLSELVETHSLEESLSLLPANLKDRLARDLRDADY